MAKSLASFKFEAKFEPVKHLFFDASAIMDLLEGPLAALTYAYDHSTHRLVIQRPGHQQEAFFRLPMHSRYTSNGFHLTPPPNYALVLIQSGSASIGVFEGQKCLEHKVFSAYMVRKKQGKSQVKYLKTKGKSRAGSRVRLAKTVEFFEQINTRLQKHEQDYYLERIGLSCSKLLIPYLYNAKVAPPFQKKDERLYRIPRHINQPNHEELLKTQRYLCKAELSFHEEEFPELISLA